MNCYLETLMDSLPSSSTDMGTEHNNNFQGLIDCTMLMLFNNHLQQPVTDKKAFVKVISAYKIASNSLERLSAYRQLNKIFLPNKVQISQHTRINLLIVIEEIGKFCFLFKINY